MYLDFDNIVMSWYDRVHGRNSYSRDRQRIAENPADPEIAERLSAATIDVGAIIDFAASFGTLVLTRAYADWSAPVNAIYRSQLVARAVDLVQLFPAAAYAKNGADIRLAVDAVEDMFRLPDLTHVVIVAGDSDYVPLAQRCKRLGRYVVGVGVAGSTAKSLAAACDEFEAYDSLPGVPRFSREPARAVEGPRQGRREGAGEGEGRLRPARTKAKERGRSRHRRAAVGRPSRSGEDGGDGCRARPRRSRRRREAAAADAGRAPQRRCRRRRRRGAPRARAGARDRGRAQRGARDRGAAEAHESSGLVEERGGDRRGRRRRSRRSRWRSPPRIRRTTATRLLERALRLGHDKNDDSEWLHSSAVKTHMRRMDPSFSEKALGYRSFNDFVKARESIAELEETGHERLVRLRE